ncbi:urea ABC transporter permease subunit UrtB [uncultured Desulfovibrio sp.]|uniref:urea ABC transporter permease subunit UrtB n=1 Tax=uncultured Desulfovibrio sp. TaxID=167968 RepID=UPI002597EA1F|nr:urea ABC transporter permease subunit UrtB [uncultured Desulfovibrio sp.]
MFALIKRVLDLAGSFSPAARRSLTWGMVCNILKAFFMAGMLGAVFWALENRDHLDAVVALQCLGILAVSVIGQYVFQYLVDITMDAQGFHIFRDLRLRVGDRLKAAPMGYFSEQRLSAVTTTLTTTVHQLEEFMTICLTGLTGGVAMAVIMSLFFLAVAWPIAAITFAGIAAGLCVLNVLRRRAAAAALMESAVPPLKAPALRALLDVEKDAPTRASLEAALALHTAADKSATPADLLQAVAALDANGAPTACNALNALADSADPAVAKAAQDALYRQRVAAQWGGFFEMFFFGLSLGSILVLAATGLAITFGVMGVINMAHGEFIMLGAYTAWGVQQMLPGRPGLALLLAVPAALLVSGGMGVLLERTVIRFLYGRPLETLLATFGVSLVLQQAVRSVFSPLNRAVQTPDFMSGVWQITPHFALTCNRVYIMLFCLGVFACIHAAMHRTRLGLEVRAVSQNRPIARCMGVRAARVDALTFGLGSGVAGMAGVALSQVTNVGPNLGQGYIIDSFMVVVFGGVGNLWGTLTGGLALGVANKFLEPVSGAMLSKIIILVCLILFIQKRPRGLFPQKGRAVEA